MTENNWEKQWEWKLENVTSRIQTQIGHMSTTVCSNTNLFLMLTSSLHNIYDLENVALMRVKIY